MPLAAGDAHMVEGASSRISTVTSSRTNTLAGTVVDSCAHSRWLLTCSLKPLLDGIPVAVVLGPGHIARLDGQLPSMPQGLLDYETAVHN